MAAVLAPPPTANALCRHQRRRLMRSTRKLGAVLGTTPLLLESEDTDAPCLHPPKRSFSLSRSSEDKHIKSHTRTSSTMTHHRQDTVSLRISTTSPSSASSSRSSFEVISIPSTTSSPAPPTKLTKPPTHPRPLLLRLNPASAAQHDVPALSSTSHSHSPSVSSPSPSIISFTTPPSPTLTIAPTPTPAPDVARRRKMAKLKRTLGENIPFELVFRQTETRNPTPPRLVPPVMSAATRSHTLATIAPVAVLSSQLKHPKYLKYPRRPSSSAPFSTTHGNVPPDDDPVKIKARDWSGEWNLDDIREVQDGLRALKP